MQNLVILAGNVGAAPETTTTNRDTTITKFSLATSRPKRDSEGRIQKDRDGRRVEDTEWHRVTCFNGVAKTVAEYVEKGQKVMVRGLIHYTRYTDKDNIERYGVEIIADEVTLTASATSARSISTVFAAFGRSTITISTSPSVRRIPPTRPRPCGSSRSSARTSGDPRAPRRSAAGALLRADIGMLAAHELDGGVDHVAIVGAAAHLDAPVAARMEDDRQRLDRADPLLPGRRVGPGYAGNQGQQQRPQFRWRKRAHRPSRASSPFQSSVVDVRLA
jgi:single-strand DNA-binding protein